MNKDEVDIAVHAAKEAGRKWKLTTIDKRGEILYRAAEILLEQVKSHLINQLVVLVLTQVFKKYKHMLPR